jgi:hypothetical protein
MTGGSNGPEATSSTSGAACPDVCAGLAEADCDDPGGWALVGPGIAGGPCDAESSWPVLTDVVSDVLSPPQPPKTMQAHAASTIPSWRDGERLKILPLERRPRFERLGTVCPLPRRGA